MHPCPLGLADRNKDPILPVLRDCPSGLSVGIAHRDNLSGLPCDRSSRAGPTRAVSAKRPQTGQRALLKCRTIRRGPSWCTPGIFRCLPVDTEDFGPDRSSPGRGDGTSWRFPLYKGLNGRAATAPQTPDRHLFRC